jgi:response regulator RpfG family c-di-GMP phosphodiesterase
MCAVGKDGLSFALRRDRPDLIVTELKARDLCLTDLMNRLTSSDETRCIPVLVVTTSCDSKVLTEPTVAGVVAVLPKLTDFGVLRARATALIPNAVPRG